MLAGAGLCAGAPMKPVTVEASSGDHPSLAADSDSRTRWASDVGDNQWLLFDLGEPSEIAGVQVHWEEAYALDYEVLGSTNKVDWRVLKHTRRGVGDVEVNRFDPVEVRYIKLALIRPATEWGFSIYECRFLSRDGVKEPEMPAWASDSSRAQIGRTVMRSNFDDGLDA